MLQSIEQFLKIILITFAEWSKKEDIIIVQNREHGNHLEICASFRGIVMGKGDVPNPGRAWNSSQELAKRVLRNHHQKALIDITDGATHYHASWMESYPRWSKERKVMASIDNHIFYGSKKL